MNLNLKFLGSNYYFTQSGQICQNMGEDQKLDCISILSSLIQKDILLETSKVKVNLRFE